MCYAYFCCAIFRARKIQLGNLFSFVESPVLKNYSKKSEKDFADKKKRSIFASQNKKGTRCSAVRLAHLVWDQRVGGSNPFTSTEKEKLMSFHRLLFLCASSG